jgi:beta-galactosidase
LSREVLQINRNWLYSSEVVAGCTDKDFDDSAFERVTIPHANHTCPWHSFDDKDYQFISAYRRHFTLPKELEARRLFVDFEGVMTAATVYINGKRLGEHRGGYTPFSFELTSHVDWESENVLAVEVDSTERSDIPPFGGRIDYLTFGGIYREVALRATSETFIENVFAKPVDVMDDPRVEVRCFLDSNITPVKSLTLAVELRDGDRVVGSESREVLLGIEAPFFDLSLEDLGRVELWKLDNPKLYEVLVQLHETGELTDEYVTRIGFREAWFTPEGFYLNGRRLKLRGLNRHQTYPYVGGAMPARVQRRDALILKDELKCNVVRTSHYPQSRHFLNCCDEIGLLVFEEIPGWQHIGNEVWKELSCRDVEAMIRRDWNRPSIILWGVRINESPDDHNFYTTTNEIAHALDDSRQTGGVRNFFESEFLEDVFTINDFNPDSIRPPNHPLYLNTEFVGHMFPTKRIDNVERVQEHVLRHARIHNMLGAIDRFAGGIGWCAFDYNTHADFGSGDRVCYHGVSDIFRIPKAAAGFYKSQCDPGEELVLEPAFHWAIGDRSEGGGPGWSIICSNCDRLKIYLDDQLRDDVEPDTKSFGHLSQPPFFSDQLTGLWGRSWRDLRIDGYLNGRKVISKSMSADGVDHQFYVEPDDTELLGDGIDATRVVFRVTDEFGNLRPFATGAITLKIEGPCDIIGENPFALTGGVGAIWVKTREEPGIIRLLAKHPVLGTRMTEILVREVQGELC